MSDRAQPFTGRRLKWLIWISLFSGLAYLGASIWGGWQDVVKAMGRVGLSGAAIALLLSLFNYGLRFARWQYYLHLLGHQFPVVESLRIYIAGFSLTIVPGKAGEAIRSVFLKQHGMGYRHSLAAFFTERFSDLISVLILTAIGVFQYQKAQPVVLVLAVVLIVLLMILYRADLIIRLHAGMRLPQRFLPPIETLADIMRHSGHCLRPRAMLVGIGLGVVSWGAEGMAFYFILHWMGAGVDWEIAMFIYAFAMLVGAISFMPGGVGGAEAAMIGLLLVNACPEPIAVAATVVTRLATLWFAVALGIIALLQLVRREASITEK